MKKMKSMFFVNTVLFGFAFLMSGTAPAADLTTNLNCKPVIPPAGTSRPNAKMDVDLLYLPRNGNSQTLANFEAGIYKTHGDGGGIIGAICSGQVNGQPVCLQLATGVFDCDDSNSDCAAYSSTMMISPLLKKCRFAGFLGEYVWNETKLEMNFDKAPPLSFFQYLSSSSVNLDGQFWAKVKITTK
jgi:hypothetical protein